ncbi:aromatic acid exporter family protein [Ornithinibacillus halophilus]|uniref:Uncharacterized membrane protein YgaE, UPF0421/DUF939 family n=1 Tax=Ornithinibacillus halophilus TaxID=930117 RepID=A0A1M5F7N0_9BACI|nr:aromatic acid exporter family protein [Ornithinibacillus halophilus]SHF87071.1 Uncharacterized membrane protein YgaE, UPF0421/DUF939 family [Ornithinibacillus halophilus]
MKRPHLIGNRVIKTAVAIFLTAWLCELLNWPPVFAVITAIVTLEPTVAESIKKGIIRFPASAIGSAYAVLFISLFGNSPITYTLAAAFTIATCFRFKLHAGLLVATLTAVAMVEVIHSNYLISFFIRLGTTTIGLVVSTAVNMFILPPDYTKNITDKIHELNSKSGTLIEQVFNNILTNNKVNQNLITEIDKHFSSTETLIRYQEEESIYHPLASDEKDQFQQAKEQISTLRMIHYHLENVINTPVDSISWSKEERLIILNATKELARVMKEENYLPETCHARMKELTEIFWEDNEEITKNNEQHPTHFPPELIILYELISIYELITAFYEREKSVSM